MWNNNISYKKKEKIIIYIYFIVVGELKLEN